MIGCDCPVCTSADPRDQRTRASIYIETPECAFVIDTGPDFRQQMLRENAEFDGQVTSQDGVDLRSSTTIAYQLIN